MEKRFSCTACGKCCHGWVPLTIGDALAHAHRFPLAMVWTPVRPGGKSYSWISRLGITVKLEKHRQFAVRVSPTAYIPPSLPCPALTSEGLCGIHDDKPARCRAMPFSPYHDEVDQVELLVPKPDWACDTSETAPVVYRDGKILDREDYERELKEIQEEAPIIRAYAEGVLESAPTVAEQLSRTALKPSGGHVVLNFSALIARLPKVDIFDFAEKQLPVLRAFASRTAVVPTLAEYHQVYRSSTAYLERLLKGRPASPR